MADKKMPERVFEKIYGIVMFICKLLLIADVLIVSYAVLGRYVGKYIPFFDDPAWSEEIVLTCMIYMAFLSAALAVRKGTHIRMTALDRFLPKRLLFALDMLAYVLVLIFALIMVKEGFAYAITVGAKASYTSLSWLSRFWMYAPVPISGLAIALFQIEVIIKRIKRRKKGE